MAVEGQTAIGPNGERAVFRNGQWVVMPAQPQMPANPAFPYEGQQAQANVEKTVTDIEGTKTSIVDTQADNARADKKLAAELYAKGLEIGPDGSPRPIPNWTPPPTADKKPQMSDNTRSALELLRIIDGSNGLQEQFEENFSGGASPAEYTWFGLNPSSAPYNFADKANAALPYVKKFMRTPGEGANSDKDQAVYERLLPSPNVRDSQNVQRIEDMRQAALAVLRQEGIDVSTYDGSDPQNRGTVWEQNRLVTGARPQAAPAGSDKKVDALPPEMQQEYAAFLQQWVTNPDPAAMARFRTELDRKYNYQGDPQQYLADAQAMADALRRGGATISAEIPGTEREMTTGAFSEQARNDAVNNPVGAAAVGFADMFGAGAVTAVAGNDRMQALSEAQPWPMLGGQIVGAIGGTGLLGRGAREVSKRVLPGLLGGGKRAQFGRNVATDVAYSGAYGANSGNGALESAGEGGAGSVLGQIVGSGIGRGVSGVTSSPTVSRLRQQGVTPSLGQIMRGRANDSGGRSVVAGIEDVIANNGAVGTFVNSARGRALEDANLAAFNTVSGGRPITEIGEGGLAQLDAAKDAAYRNALDGVSVPADDPAFIQNMRQAGQRGQAVDAARGRGDFNYIMDQELGPVLGEGPVYSGEQLQDAMRLLQGQSRAYQKAATGATPDPAAMGVSRSLNEITGALTDLAGEYSPDTLPRLNEANSIYRGLQVLDDAAARGMNEGGTFTGAQLGSAIKSNTGKFEGKGLSKASQSPLYQLQQDMQAVLPNQVPPTGVNAAPMLAMGSAAMGAGGYATDNDWLTAAGALGMLATPYTRAGQAVTARALLDRPEAIRRAGSLIRQNKGLFGRVALPFAVAEY